MKRGSKKSVRNHKTVETSPTNEPWAAWYRFVAYNHLLAVDCELSTGVEELEWVRSQLSKIIDVSDISDCSLDACESNHASSLNKSQKSSLVVRSSVVRSMPPAMILLASSNRNDPIERVATELVARYPDASIRLVLGEWWTGHRRTWPIAKGLNSIYWYQCHDLLLPELLVQRDKAKELSSNRRLALVVSEDSSIRQMWLEVLPGLGFHPLAAFDTDALPEGNVDVVFLDSTDATGHLDFDLHREAEQETTVDASKVAILRRTYPQSKIVVCFGFPRWHEVRRTIQSGADFILGKPFRLEGLSTILALS